MFADANWKSHMKTKSLDPRRSMRRAFERNIVELQEAFLCNGQAQIGFSAMSQAHRSDGWRLVVALSHFRGLGTPWVYGGWVLPFIPKGRGHSRPELSWLDLRDSQVSRFGRPKSPDLTRSLSLTCALYRWKNMKNIHVEGRLLRRWPHTHDLSWHCILCSRVQICVFSLSHFPKLFWVMPNEKVYFEHFRTISLFIWSCQFSWLYI